MDKPPIPRASREASITRSPYDIVRLPAKCTLCDSETWCGRRCMSDPHKTNALIFHPDGRPKTLKERGLGWPEPGDPPFVVPMRGKPIRPTKAKRTETPVTKVAPENPATVTKSPAVTKSVTKKGRPTLGNKPLTPAEKMRLYRQRKQPKP